MLQKHITTSKTARYFQLGTFSESTRRVIIACHGYAQLAEYFLKWFEEINTEETVIIAPEGLHRFYWKGFNGKVVASWMTKEDRENDIKDYCLFLDNVMDQLPLDDSIQCIALGFSQGAATISRWAASTHHNINHLVLWAGVFPDDVSIEQINFKFDTPIHVLFGDEDEFYQNSELEELRNYLSEKHLNFEFISFQGKHKIYPKPLNNLLQKLSSP